MNKVDKKNIILSVVFSLSLVLFGIAFAKIVIFLR
jgi:hypothetical protein